MARTYWLDLFTYETWQEFREHGADISGFPESRWKSVQRMRTGDYLLCYLTQASRWVGVLEVTADAFQDESPIWSGAVYPSRIHVRPVVALDPELGVPVLEMREDLSIFQGLTNPNRWSGPFRRAPVKWKTSDGEKVLEALLSAKANPIKRPLRKPTRGGSKSASGEVIDRGQDTLVVPVDEGEAEDLTGDEGALEAEGSTHTEIQYLLMKLGADMGFDVHLARNDASRTWKGQRLGEMPRRREQLPQQFDPATNRTIELIDLLWLQGNAIVAAFEIESTTSIYSGLLRMSDLLSMQPNIAVPLFLVAPEGRREKVVHQVNRPTFERMDPPLVEVCRYISFENLRDSLTAAQQYIKYLKADWLQTVSESCAVEEG